MRASRSGRLLEFQVLLMAHALLLALLAPNLPRDRPWIVGVAGMLGLAGAHLYVRAHYPESGRAYVAISLLLSGLSLWLFYQAPPILAVLALLHPYLCFRLHERLLQRHR